MISQKPPFAQVLRHLLKVKRKRSATYRTWADHDLAHNTPGHEDQGSNDQVRHSLELQYRLFATDVAIRGVQPHKSHKDPTETQKVISLQFFDENEKRLASGHVRADGTGTIRYKRGSEP